MPEAMAEAQRARNLAGDKLLASIALNYTRSVFQRFSMLRQPLEVRWARSWNAYWNKPVKTYYNGRSKVTPPDIHVRVERLAPRLEDMSIGDGDFFEVRPRTATEDRKASANKDLMYAQLDNDNFRYQFGSQFARDVIVYGTGVSKVGWRYLVEMEDVVTAEPSTAGFQGMDKPYRRQMHQRVVNRPHAEPRDIFDIYADPRVSSVEQTDIVEECLLTLDELLEMEAAGLVSNLDRAVRAPFTGTLASQTTGVRELRDRALGVWNTPKGSKVRNLFKYREFWGLFPISATNESEVSKVPAVPCVIGVVNDEFVVRLERNPFRGGWKPYDFWKILPIRGELYGKSLVEMGLELWYEKRDTRNMALDTRGYVISPMILADPSYRGTGYVAGHGKVLRGANLKQMSVGDTSLAAVHHEKMASSDLDDLFATPPLLSGEELGGEGGATGAAIQDQQALINIRGYVRGFVQSGLLPVLTKWHRLNQQFLDDTVPLSVLGPRGMEWRIIVPEDTDGEFTFIHTAAKRNQNKAILGANFVNITNTFLALQTAGLVSINWDRLCKDYLELVVGQDHPELYVNPTIPEGPVPATGQVIEMLVLGHKLVPDTRGDIVKHWQEMTLFVSRVVPEMRNEAIKRNVLDYYADLDGAVKMVLQQRAAALAERRLLLLGAKPKGSAQKEEEPGAKGEKRPEHRDGKGMAMSRRLMASMQGGPMGAPRG